MFITPAFADTATGAATAATTAAADAPAGVAGALASPLLPLTLVFVVFYFFVIRPQNKRAQEHRQMIAALQVGDKVVTGGGLIGTVKKVVDDNEIVLELAQGVNVHALRSTILSKKV
jgi:preprotein translocase subunit YajC